jgi:hypothetical protein
MATPYRFQALRRRTMDSNMVFLPFSGERPESGREYKSRWCVAK